MQRAILIAAAALLVGCMTTRREYFEIDLGKLNAMHSEWNRHYNAGDYDAALDALDRFGRGITAVKRRFYQEWYGQEQAWFLYYRGRALTFLRKNELDKSETAFAQAFSRFGWCKSVEERADLYYERGRLLYTQQRYRAAATDFDRAAGITRNPDTRNRYIDWSVKATQRGVPA